MMLASVLLPQALILPALSISTSALIAASTSQSLERRRGGRQPVTIETSAAACSLAYLLLYELNQGASLHTLAREVRGAAEDKGIGRSAALRKVVEGAADAQILPPGPFVAAAPPLVMEAAR